MFFLNAAAPSLITASEQYCQRGKLSRAKRGVKCTANVGHSTTYYVPSLEKQNMTAARSSATREVTLGQKMRFRGFGEDGLVYKESFVVWSSQVGVNKTATIETIASLLQETACNRVRCLGWSTDGFPTTPTMRKLRLTWITSRVHIEMYKYPAWDDVLEIEHWSEAEGRIAMRLDSIIRNLSTGEVIGRSTSKWLMMNKDTRKLHKISGEVKEEYLAICTKSPRSAFLEKNHRSSKKIFKLNEPADYSQLGLMPRRADLDMNKHVNNVTYYSWLLQSIPQDVVDTHELEAITIEFRRECHYGDFVDSLASNEVEIESLDGCHDEWELSDSNPNSEGRLQFLHLLKFSGTDHEINRGRTVWRKLER